MEFHRELSFVELLFVLKLYISNITNEEKAKTIFAMEKDFEFNYGNPIIRNLIREFIPQNIFICKSINAKKADLYYFDRPKLKKIRDAQQIYQLFKKNWIYDIP